MISTPLGGLLPPVLSERQIMRMQQAALEILEHIGLLTRREDVRDALTGQSGVIVRGERVHLAAWMPQRDTIARCIGGPDYLATTSWPSGRPRASRHYATTRVTQLLRPTISFLLNSSVSWTGYTTGQRPIWCELGRMP